MKRREFIAGLGGAAAWPVVAQAQQPRVEHFVEEGAAVGSSPFLVLGRHRAYRVLVQVCPYRAA